MVVHFPLVKKYDNLNSLFTRVIKKSARYINHNNNNNNQVLKEKPQLTLTLLMLLVGFAIHIDSPFASDHLYILVSNAYSRNSDKDEYIHSSHCKIS